MSLPASYCGYFTPFLIRANSVMTLGRKTLIPIWAAWMSGARSLLTRNVGSPISLSLRQSMNCMAATGTGNNLYGDCLLALDARTGKYLWHYQTIHHDVWDYDPTAAPQLVTVKHDGKNVDVVALASKNGFLYVFDRVTGKPIWPIVEKPVPQSDVPGEMTSPTQPFPTAPPAIRAAGMDGRRLV